nr:MAG TPA: Transcription initiation factor [Caudoviricetes sp.]
MVSVNGKMVPVTFRNENHRLFVLYKAVIYDAAE